MVSKKALNALLVSAVAFSTAAATLTARADEVSTEKEKCYGVAKAGMNDCASASGSHSCGAQAASDRIGDEWVAVPKGICDKLAGGSLTPISANSPPSAPGTPGTAPTEAEENHEH